MIDTVKFLIPADKATIVRIQTKCERTRREHLTTKEVTYEYYREAIKVGSHNHSIIINPKETFGGIFVEFSVPKYVFGNNVEMIKPREVREHLEKFKSEMESHFDIKLSSLESWEIFRLDFCYNWTLQESTIARGAMDFIQKIDYPRKKKYLYDTSVMYKGSSYTIKFYLKGPEFLKNSRKEMEQKRGVDITSFYTEWAFMTLRYEVELKKKHLQKIYKKEQIFFSTETMETAEQVLRHYLDKVFKFVPIDQFENENVRQLISRNFSPIKALRLYQFYKAYYCGDETKLLYQQGGLDRSTIYRYRKDLYKIGVTFKRLSKELEMFDMNILKTIQVPSFDAIYTLQDYMKNTII